MLGRDKCKGEKVCPAVENHLSGSEADLIKVSWMKLLQIRMDSAQEVLPSWT